MRKQRLVHKPLEALSWTVSWDQDRRDDRRSLQFALGGAILVHAALLVIRLTDVAPVASFRPDAVIFPTHDVVIRKPVEVPEPRTAADRPRPSPVKVPVPAEFAPPEPLFEPDLADFAPELPTLAAPFALLAVTPPTAEPGPVRVSGDIVRPVRLSGIEPTYTEAARRSRTEGLVVLDAVIDREGRVTEIEVLRPLGFGLTESAVRAVRGWRFEPASLNGRPLTVRYNLTVRFSLR